MLKEYLKNISNVYNRGDAREESYYDALKSLLQNYASERKLKSVDITTLPRATEAGNPDFRIWDGKQHIIGYIEAKTPGTNLDKIEGGEQLKRYLDAFPNMILTNFLEFRFYGNGREEKSVVIGHSKSLTLGAVPPLVNESDFMGLMEQFFFFRQPHVLTAEKLAVELAKRTKILGSALFDEMKTNPDGRIQKYFDTFSNFLNAGLTGHEFADLFAQTVAYGLFAARTRSGEDFNRQLAYNKIPRTIGILRDVFRFISLEDPPKGVEWIIDDISGVLAVTDVQQILHGYFHDHKGSDPIVHFYETFLKEYDPAVREQRGVYYTPEPVVSYIVRSLNIILKEKFGRAEGFASDNVTVLDPAAGTLTFMAEAAKLAVKEHVAKHGDGHKEEFIRTRILNRNPHGDDVLKNNFYAFELMMAPYAIGHIKMSFLMEELGCKLHDDDRFMLFLTNALDMGEIAQTDTPGIAALSEESHNAGRVKKEKPILVIMGNPPYSGHSANKSEKVITVKDGSEYVSHYDLRDGKLVANTVKARKDSKVKQKTWIGRLIEDYKYVDGQSLGEKNPKWLQDDYVKFIRFSQWKIDQAGEGVLGFITNHGYLDNPTFRGMRRSLMNSFNEIYILDLHGNSLKKERCPDGSEDKNVFDIRQGVSIMFCIKEKGSQKKCSVRHADLWGKRKDKYEWLIENDLHSTKWSRLEPRSGFYLFVPKDEYFRVTYEKGVKITDIFPLNSVGIVTARDRFIIDSDKNALKRRVAQFRNKKQPDEMIAETYCLGDKSNWNVKAAREAVMKDDDWEKAITKILYRPFDEQWIFYHDAVIERSRKEVMQHMINKNNIGLITNRQVNGSFRHVFCSDKIINDCTVSLETRERSYIFPLYLYKTVANKPKGIKSFGTFMLFEPEAGYKAKKPNLDERLVGTLASAYKKDISPEEIFFYIYAVLYSNTYRTKYADFLRTDFPRVPFTADKSVFKKMAALGEKLVGLHLMKSKELDRPVARFMGKGDGGVEKPIYNADEKRVYINKTQYFEGVSPEIWEYQIGGYRVAEKWLKDRKGRELSLEDTKHYCRIIASLGLTMGIQKEIAPLFDRAEKDVISIEV